MTIRPIRNQCLCLVFQTLALLNLLLPNHGLAHDVPNPAVAGKQKNADIQQSELPNPEFSPRGPFQGPITIPHIARFDNLPMRMFLEPHLISPGTVEKVDSSFMELFDKTLREFDDAELLETAALSLARVAHEKLNDELSRSTDILLKHLESHASLRVRFACARALVNADVSQSAAAVLALEKHADDTQRLWIDPALARWKTTAAGDVWRQRLANDSETTLAVSLACEGLTSLGDTQASELLLSVLRGKLLAYEKRSAAAKSLRILAPDAAFAASEPFVNGSVPEKLLAVELLSSEKTDSHTRLVALCADESDGVAASAWKALLQQKPEALISKLSEGRSHGDAMIRMTAARIMQLFPDSERSGWLHEQLSDRHLEVRNVAREMLLLVAEEHADLRDGIIDMVSDTLAANGEDWQGIEQCLLLLGQLRTAQFSDRCLPLLDHPRNEVLVTSAWLLHLFPDPAVADGVKGRLIRNEESLRNPDGASARMNLDKQSSYLVQYAGLLRLDGIQPYLEPAIRKAPRVYTFKRAAAIWTLGLLNENNPAPDLAKSFAGRVSDRLEPGAEQLEVRRISAVALGLMRAKSAASELLEAYEVDPSGSVIPDSARWALGMLGEPLPDPVKPYAPIIGGWKLSPIADQ